MFIIRNRDYFNITINGERGWLQLAASSDADVSNALDICVQALEQKYPDISNLQFSENECPRKDELKYLAYGSVTYSNKTGSIKILDNHSMSDVVDLIKFKLVDTNLSNEDG